MSKADGYCGRTEESACCAIEHHAVLFALLSRSAIELCGEQGKEAILAGVDRYGEERGKRMARRAQGHGDSLDLVSYQAYGEWRAQPGQMETVVLRTEPALVTTITKCAWYDAWKKYGLLEYGKYYCLPIDAALYRGFRPDLTVKPFVNLSWGNDRCEFDWGRPLPREDEDRLERKRKELGDSCVRDFNFHAAHLFHTVGGVLAERLGEKGKTAAEEAVPRFIELFGAKYWEAVAGTVAEF